jgi:hypothetical protein
METYKSIFKGEVKRNKYIFLSRYPYAKQIESDIYNFPEHVEWKDICKVIIEKPPIEIDEKVYINELDMTVTVNDRVRSTNGEIIYYIKDYECIEDDISKESLDSARNARTNYMEELKIENSHLESLKNKEKWWQFWK